MTVDCIAVVDRRYCPIHLREEQPEEDQNLIRSSARLKTQARLERRKGLGRGWETKVREMEVQVMSYCRAHRESVPRRV